MKKTIPITAFGCVIIAITAYYSGPSSPVRGTSDPIVLTDVVTDENTVNQKTVNQNNKLDNSAIQALLTVKPDEFTPPQMQRRWIEMNERRREPAMSKEAFEEAVSATLAWSVEDEPAAGLPLAIDEIHDGREFISFNRNKIETLMPGDEMELPIHQINTQYKMVVEEVIQHGDGNITWNGFLKGESSEYSVSITQGEKNTYAGISTPEGHFTLEVHNNDGWTVSTKTLAKFNANEPDYLLPDITSE